MFDNVFGRGLAPRQSLNALNHESIRLVLVLQRLGVTIVDIVLLGNAIQSIDARVSPLQALVQMRPGSHILITGPMKFNPHLLQHLLQIELATPLASLATALASHSSFGRH